MVCTQGQEFCQAIIAREVRYTMCTDGSRESFGWGYLAVQPVSVSPVNADKNSLPSAASCISEPHCLEAKPGKSGLQQCCP